MATKAAPDGVGTSEALDPMGGRLSSPEPPNAPSWYHFRAAMMSRDSRSWESTDPCRTEYSGAVSSVGRAPARQAGGHWFEPSTAHSCTTESPANAGLFSKCGTWWG